MSAYPIIDRFITKFFAQIHDLLQFIERHRHKLMALAAIAFLFLQGIEYINPKGENAIFPDKSYNAPMKVYEVEINKKDIIQIDTAHGVGYAAQVNFNVTYPLEMDRKSIVLTEDDKPLVNYAGVNDPDRITAMGGGSFNVEQRKILRKQNGWEKTDGEIVFVPFDNSDPRNSNHKYKIKVDAYINPSFIFSIAIFILIVIFYWIKVNPSEQLNFLKIMKSYFLKRFAIGDINLLFPLLILFFLGEVLYTSWISDDGSITLHSVLNFVHGYGPVLNIGERVQAFTHPLWFFLNSAMWFITHQVYFGVTLLGIICSLSAYYLFIRYVSPIKSSALIAAILILGSKSYIEYSTSALENSLSHLIIVVLAIIIFSEGISASKRFLLLFFALSLLYITRSDLVLLFTPFSLYFMYNYLRSVVLTHNNILRSTLKNIAVLLLVTSPAILWTVFSIVYYGFPFPNTAYAKITNYMPFYVKLNQGIIYILDGCRFDPLTMGVILAGILLGFFGNKKIALISGGIVLYIIYIMLIGGDFMRGRFFTASFLLSLCIISQFKLYDKTILAAVLITILSVAKAGHNYYFNNDDYQSNYAVVDERVFYKRQESEEQNILRDFFKFYNQPWQFTSFKEVGVSGTGLGIGAIQKGPEIFKIDPYGLSDPLLARLPADHDQQFHAGHSYRYVPYGYKQSIIENKNLLTDPATRDFYEKIRLVTRGELFSWERFRAIIDLNLRSTPEDLVKFYQSGMPLRFRNATLVKLGTDPNRNNATLVSPIKIENNAELRFGRKVTVNHSISLVLSGGSDFKVEYAKRVWVDVGEITTPEKIVVTPLSSKNDILLTLILPDAELDYLWIRNTSNDGGFTIKDIKID